MAVYFGCDIPEDLYYHPRYDSWIRFEGDDLATMGMTDIAQTQAGKLINIRFKPVGTRLRAGKFAATIESGKWIGPFVMPFDAEIVATNAETFRQNILIANQDPYGEGWLIKVRLLDPAVARAELLTGEEAVAFFRQKIETHKIRCFRCVIEEAE